MKYWIGPILFSLTVFFTVGLCIKSLTHFNQNHYLNQGDSKVDWIAVNSYLKHQRTPGLTSELESSKTNNHIYHLTKKEYKKIPKKYKDYFAMGVGIFFMLVIYVFITNQMRKEHD